MITFLQKRKTKKLDLQYACFAEENFEENLPTMVATITSLEDLKLPLYDGDIFKKLILTVPTGYSLMISVWKKRLSLDPETIWKSCVRQLSRVCNPISIIDWSPLVELQNLTSLEINTFNEEPFEFLSLLTNLKSLTIYVFFAVSPPRSTITLPNANLERLRVQFPMCFMRWPNFYEMIADMKKLKQLELIEGGIYYENLQKLRKCTSLKKLLIAGLFFCPGSNSGILMNITYLFGNLEVLAWGADLYNEVDCIRVQRGHPGSHEPLLDECDYYYLTVEEVRELFKRELPQLNFILFKYGQGQVSHLDFEAFQ